MADFTTGTTVFDEWVNIILYISLSFHQEYASKYLLRVCFLFGIFEDISFFIISLVDGDGQGFSVNDLIILSLSSIEDSLENFKRSGRVIALRLFSRWMVW